MAAPAIPLIWIALEKAGEALVGLAIGTGLYKGGEALYNEMSKAKEEAPAMAEKGAVADACSTCPPPPNDPCKGLRNQLEAHKQKLVDYMANPHAHDNKGFLGLGRDADIIAKRIKSLNGQIENFKKQLDECEKAHGKK